MTKEIRCPNCGKKLCEASGVGLVILKAVCNRCKTNYSETLSKDQPKEYFIKTESSMDKH